jgi:hypothetical protein
MVAGIAGCLDHDRQSAPLCRHAAALNQKDICRERGSARGEIALAPCAKGTIPDHPELKTGVHGVSMKDASGGVSGLDRRGSIQLAAAGAGLAGGCGAALKEPSETRADITRQPSPSFTEEINTADIVVETLIACGATQAFEVVKARQAGRTESLTLCCNVRPYR